jgi:hypothetical protein
MRTKPSGTMWSRKRRRNSSASSSMTLTRSVSIVAPAETDAALGKGDEPVVGEGDAIQVECVVSESSRLR